MSLERVATSRPATSGPCRRPPARVGDLAPSDLRPPPASATSGRPLPLCLAPSEPGCRRLPRLVPSSERAWPRLRA